MPLLVVMLTTPPPNRPYSELTALLETRNSWMASWAGTSAMVFEFRTLSVPPSMNQALWPAMPPPIWKLPHPALLVWVPWFMVVGPSLEPWGTTPGARAIRFMTLRPLSGISCTCSPETTELSSPDSVCSSFASAETSTVSVISPTSSAMSTRTVACTCTRNRSRVSRA